MMIEKKEKIAVLVSGGVDSSVALALLKRQGYDVTAFYLKIWLEDELSYLAQCPWQEDLEYVQKVCEQCDVPLEVIPLQQEYHEKVVAYTLAEIKAGHTPNPDVLCNQYIKFGLFIEKIDSRFTTIASGHYAQTRLDDNGMTVLFQSPDPVKDQTYFLSRLSQAQLRKIIFPIGYLYKHQVRQLAQEFDMPNKDRKDSQGICFLGKFKFSDFVKHHLGNKEGQMIEIETGAIMGIHNGFWFYTIGQRQGLKLAGGPWYVVEKDTKKNIVYISRNYYSREKKRDSFEVSDAQWFINKPLKNMLTVKVRHGAYKNQCLITFDSHGGLQVQLAQRDQGIAPGQYAVFYDGDVCLGGGVITKSF